MEVIETGHIYKPAVRNAGTRGENAPASADRDAREQRLIFVNKQPGQQHDGTTTQEVIRILIDRTRHCANCMPHPNNERIVYHLRMALVLHEARALERKTEKGDFLPEYLTTGDDGHIAVSERAAGDLDTTVLIPHRHDWDRQCNHPAAPTTGPKLVKTHG
ncbi:hypothetical protein J8F10_24360 [Gemmata sp. G18]|uniref:Uncharacterized protein n=1 Tax=Gemmata palustris TaxID=2822762 RepID=A0ABS5BXK4_9BACT|nr:hypothetical protein [Gemmata palustris]MBP3958395.1 hypothetical protein [Gemmata palustris]